MIMIYDDNDGDDNGYGGDDENDNNDGGYGNNYVHGDSY